MSTVSRKDQQGVTIINIGELSNPESMKIIGANQTGYKFRMPNSFKFESEIQAVTSVARTVIEGALVGIGSLATVEFMEHMIEPCSINQICSYSSIATSSLSFLAFWIIAGFAALDSLENKVDKLFNELFLYNKKNTTLESSVKTIRSVCQFTKILAKNVVYSHLFIDFWRSIFSDNERRFAEKDSEIIHVVHQTIAILIMGVIARSILSDLSGCISKRAINKVKEM